MWLGKLSCHERALKRRDVRSSFVAVFTVFTVFRRAEGACRVWTTTAGSGETGRADGADTATHSKSGM